MAKKTTKTRDPLAGIPPEMQAKFRDPTWREAFNAPLTSERIELIAAVAHLRQFSAAELRHQAVQTEGHGKLSAAVMALLRALADDLDPAASPAPPAPPADALVRITRGPRLVRLELEVHGASVTIAISPDMAARVAAELLYIAERAAGRSLVRAFNRHLRALREDENKPGDGR